MFIFEEVSDVRRVFGTRLKQLRTQQELSQEQLGILVGLDEAVASTRINRYEKGVHQPDTMIAKKLAQVLGVSLPFLYADSGVEAELLWRFAQLGAQEKRNVLMQWGSDAGLPLNHE